MFNTVRADLAFFFLRVWRAPVLEGVLLSTARARCDVPEHRVGECMSGSVVQEEETASGDINQDPPLMEVQAGWHHLSPHCHAADEIIGVIGLASDTERDFEPHSRFLQRYSLGAIYNARLYETAQRELAEHKRAEEALQAS